jgi:hypothetical protein
MKQESEYRSREVHVLTLSYRRLILWAGNLAKNWFTSEKDRASNFGDAMRFDYTS